MPEKVKFVLLFEGTGNSEDNPSVVWHVYDKLKDTATQRKHIVSGTGTCGCFLKQLFFRGCGLDSFSIIWRQYCWLTQHVNELGFDCGQSDLYVFGFSRGAYQAQMFVDLVTQYGIPRVVEDCAKNVRDFRSSLRRFFPGKAHVATAWGKAIKYVGLFDSVSSIMSLGWYRKCAPIPKNIKGRHAISCDEIRRMFYPDAMALCSGLQKKMFRGVHSDVGWGYADTKVWGMIAAKWILEPVEQTLEFISFVRSIPDGFGEMINLFVYSNGITHVSFTFSWWLLGWRRRVVNTRKFGRRHRTLKALDMICWKTGICAPRMIWIPFVPKRWFVKYNSMRCEKARRSLYAEHYKLDPIFRNLKLY